MIFSPLLKKSIFISLLSHVTVFGIFSFSFGNKIPPADYTYVFFLGQLLHGSQVKPPAKLETNLKKGLNLDKNNIKYIFSRNSDTVLLNKIVSDSPYKYKYYLKPPFNLTFSEGKGFFMPRPLILQLPLKKEQTIIFHPLLPFSFPLYFKDRQVAHVELMFKIVPAGLKNSILVKRKISSGNLEVDLLSMRYIGHYLFIQQQNFIPNSWQIVKIDLSEKEQ
jgi:hypothetical protein